MFPSKSEPKDLLGTHNKTISNFDINIINESTSNKSKQPKTRLNNTSKPPPPLRQETHNRKTNKSTPPQTTNHWLPQKLESSTPINFNLKPPRQPNNRSSLVLVGGPNLHGDEALLSMPTSFTSDEPILPLSASTAFGFTCFGQGCDYPPIGT